MKKNIAQMALGSIGIIDTFSDEESSLRLLEMGCLPGEEIQVCNIAPLGDPIAITVSGYKLSLRRNEAASIWVK